MKDFILSMLYGTKTILGWLILWNKSYLGLFKSIHSANKVRYRDEKCDGNHEV